MIGAVVNPGRRLLVIGGGYTGQRLARAAQQHGIAVQLTSRQPRSDASDLAWLPFNSAADSTELPPAAALARTTDVVVTVPPSAAAGPGEPVLQHLGPLLRDLPLQWVGYLSTTGVYGDTGGAWVDETTPTNAGAGRSQARIAAEQAWLSSGLPVQVFRLPAIYGPGRSPFKALAAGESRLIHKPGQVFCRVHVDDIAGSLLHCQALPPEQRPAVVNVSDDCPCPSSETLGYAAHLLNLKLPPLERFEHIAASMSPMARSFWSENRRASNRLLCQTLGYTLRYRSYREGYRACLAEEAGAAPAVAGWEAGWGGQLPRSAGSAT